MKIQLFISLAILAVVKANEENLLTDYCGNTTKAIEVGLQRNKEFDEKIDEEIATMKREVELIFKEIERVTEGQITGNKVLIENLNQVKVDLKFAREKLHSLAENTKGQTQTLINLLDHDGDINIPVIKALLSNMKSLLVKTQVKLTEGKELYNKAMDDVMIIEGKVKTQVRQVKRLGDENSREYKSHAAEIRAGFYGTCTGVTVGMAILDIICLGICSATVSTSCWAGAVAGVEGSLADYRQRIADFKQRISHLETDAIGIESYVHELIEVLEDETKILNKWESASTTLQSKLNDRRYKVEILAAAKRVRKALVKNFKKLNQVAKEYLGIKEIQPMPSHFG